MQEPELIHVEESFSAFVKEFGGELISEALPPNPPFDNADYLFRNENVVAELKCLEKDILEDAEYQEKFGVLYERWLREGLVKTVGWGTFELNTADLPLECQREVYSVIKNPIERVIKKANKQIKQTKEHFDLPKAAGLLLIANDGNYSLDSSNIITIASNILSRQYSGIDGFAGEPLLRRRLNLPNCHFGKTLK